MLRGRLRGRGRHRLMRRRLHDSVERGEGLRRGRERAIEIVDL